MCSSAVEPFLAGLIRHLAEVERNGSERIAGQELEPMYNPALGKDADFEDLDPDRAQADYERLLEECRLAGEAMATASYDDTIVVRADVMSVRTVVLHMIEEYAQHNGHADLLRERIDGTIEVTTRLARRAVKTMSRRHWSEIQGTAPGSPLPAQRAELPWRR